MRSTAEAFTVAVAALGLVLVTTQAAGRQGFAPYPTQSGAMLGIGWNTFNQSKAPSSCVDFSKSAADQRVVDSHYAEVSDTSSLMEAFSISAEAKVSSLLGGGGGGSASFSRSVKLDTSGLNVAVDVKIIQHVEFAVPPGLGNINLSAVRDASASPHEIDQASFSFISAPGIKSIKLTEDALQMLRNNPALFKQTCGDGFVSTIRYGTGIQGVYVIDTKSNEEYQDLSGKVSGSFGAYAGSVEGSQKMKSLQSERRLSINYFQLGGSSDPIATTYEQFNELIHNIGANAPPNGGSPFEIGITPYRDLPNYPNHTTGTPLIESLASQYYRLQSLDAKIDEMLQGDDYFFNAQITKKALDETQDAVKLDMASIRAAVQLCAEHEKQCVQPPNIDLQDYNYRAALPVPKANLKDVTAAQAKLVRDQEALSKTPEVIGQEHCGRNIFNQKTICRTDYAHNSNYDTAKKTVDAQQKAVGDLLQTRDTTDDRYQVWIELPSIVRCHNEEFDVCLTHQQLDVIHQRMKTKPTP